MLSHIRAGSSGFETVRQNLQNKLADAEAPLAKRKMPGAACVEQVAEIEVGAAKANGTDKAVKTRKANEQKLKHPYDQRIEAEPTRKKGGWQANEGQLNLSEERDQLKSALAAALEELRLCRGKYKERLADIAELGHAIGRKDRELAQLRAQYEESELHRHVASQLSHTRIKLHTVLNQKIRLLANPRAAREISEDIRLVEASDLFDADWYLAFYPDVAEANIDPARHFVTQGAYELRNPGPNFDTLKYHRAYPDVTAAQIGGFVHYLRHGWAEKRQTFPVGEYG